jgi:two-component system, OmpR family, alkaline phosphatase synthesis response regulator PhoP
MRIGDRVSTFPPSRKPKECVKTILIADDEEDVRIIVRMRLDNHAYRLLEAGNGLDALALARSEHPDLLILDCTMPGLTGQEVVHALQEETVTACISVIMVTGKDDMPEVTALQLSGKITLVEKPFSPRFLFDHIERLLQNHGARTP